MLRTIKINKKCCLALLIMYSCVYLSALTIDAAKLNYSLSEAGKRMTEDYRLFKVISYNSDLTTRESWQLSLAKQFTLVHRKKPYYELTDVKGKVLWRKDLSLKSPYEGFNVGMIYPAEETIAQIDENKGEKVVQLFDKARNRYFFMDKSGAETFLPDNSGLLSSYGEKYGKYWLFLEERGFFNDDTVLTYFPQGRGYIMFYPDSGEIRQGTLPALPKLTNHIGEIVSTPSGDGFFFHYAIKNGWETVLYSVTQDSLTVCNDINSIKEYAFSPSGDVVIIRTYNNQNYNFSENNLIVDSKTGETLGKITNTRGLGAVADKSSGLVFVSSHGQNLLLNYFTGQLVFTVLSEVDAWMGDQLEISADGGQISWRSSGARICYRSVQK